MTHVQICREVHTSPAPPPTPTPALQLQDESRYPPMHMWNTLASARVCVCVCVCRSDRGGRRAGGEEDGGRRIWVRLVLNHI